MESQNSSFFSSFVPHKHAHEKDFKFRQITESVWLIPGENAGPGFLCGTNVYIIGKGKQRFMIDACTKNNLEFLGNIEAFMLSHNCFISKIFVTHGHFDHYQGAYDVVKLN